MQAPINTNIERIIAKIDNDFGLDNTDWVPRIAAWTIDALSILKCTPTEWKKETVEVNERITTLSCCITNNRIKVYDKDGCKINPINSKRCNCGNPSTGEISNTMDIQSNLNADDGISVATNVAMDDNTKGLIFITTEIKRQVPIDAGYVVLNGKQIELNFDTDYIIVEYETIKTEFSDAFGCALPVVPNNGILIEAIVYYCMYKILCRGQKHPVFNLSASQYGTNPYYMWTTLQEKAKRSVIFDKQGNILEDTRDLWDKSLMLFSFD